MENFSTDIYKNQYHLEWSAFVGGLADWKTFLTFTWQDYRSRDWVHSKIRWLIRDLNKGFWGKHYTRYVGHSYFSYAYALENQKREALHVHMLVDAPLHFDRIHSICKQDYWNGFCFGRKIDNLPASVSYVTKYAVKAGDVEFYKAVEFREPKFLPMWYLMATGRLRKSAERW